MESSDDGLFNHVAVTVPRDTLQEPKRTKMLEFYSGVFGWEPSPYMMDERHVVLRAYRRGQYINLTADDKHSQMRPSDHIGMQVGSFERLQTIADKARTWKDQRDPTVKITGLGCTHSENGPVYSVFIRYLLPLQIEVQYFATPDEPRYALD